MDAKQSCKCGTHLPDQFGLYPRGHSTLNCEKAPDAAPKKRRGYKYPFGKKQQA